MKFCSSTSLIYNTQRVVKIPNRCLALTHYLISLAVILYIGGYGLWYQRGYQGTSGVESVTVTKVKGVVTTNKLTDGELAVPHPEYYRRVWDASDTVITSFGDQTGGFIIVTNVVITPNQTRSTCSEALDVDKSRCKTDRDCKAGQVLALGNGPMTGKCILSDSDKKSKTCEIEGWCPVEENLPALRGRRALLEETKEFTVLVKNSIEFPLFGRQYKRRNIMESATPEHLSTCLYDPKTDPYCPTFRMGDIVSLAQEDYARVALTGAVFSLKIGWFCSFDFGASINDCRPKYSFARMDNPNAYVSPGYNFRTAVFHEENRRTLTRNVGLKIIIGVEGEGRKFDSVRLILAIGAGMGLFAVGSIVCDFLFGILCILKTRFKWKWLQFYNQDMKYDLKHVNNILEKMAHKDLNCQPPHDMEEVRTLK